MEYAGSTQARPFRAMVPPVAGVIFAVTLAFMLLFPFVRLSLDGAGEPETLLFLTKTDFGLNIFALILFIVPIAGIFASLALKARTALLVDALLGLTGLIMIPLAMITIGHDAGRDALLMSHVGPGVGMIFVTILLLVVTISSGIATLQARH